MRSNCNCNPFIVHCQHALIKNASTFADRLTHPVSFFRQCLLPCLGHVKKKDKKKKKNACKLQAGNFQFTVNSSQTGCLRGVYVIAKIPKIGLFDETMSGQIRSLYQHTYAYIDMCFCICNSISPSLTALSFSRSLPSLSLSVNQKKLRIYIASICAFICCPFVNNFRQMDRLCVCLSDKAELTVKYVSALQLTAKIPINSTPIPI